MRVQSRGAIHVQGMFVHVLPTLVNFEGQYKAREVAWDLKWINTISRVGHLKISTFWDLFWPLFSPILLKKDT